MAYLRGLFLARGSLSLASGRTHLEFVVPPAEAPVLAAHLEQEGLPAAWRVRRGWGVVTWKSADTVGLFLRRIGAGAALLELEARQVARALRGDLNRSSTLSRRTSTGRSAPPAARSRLSRSSTPTAGSRLSRPSSGSSPMPGARRPRRRSASWPSASTSTARRSSAPSNGSSMSRSTPTRTLGSVAAAARGRPTRATSGGWRREAPPPASVRG